MSLYDYMLRTPITIERATLAPNENGMHGYGSPETIHGRLCYEQREIVDKDGQRRTSDATLYTSSRVRPGDRVTLDALDRRPILAVYERQDVFGRTDHWEARL